MANETEIKFNLLNAAEKVTIHNHRTKSTTEEQSLSSGDKIIAYSSTEKDTLSITVYETNKAASHTIKTTVEAMADEITIVASSYIYTGQSQSPTATAISGGALKMEYKIQGDLDNTYTTTKPVNAGSYTLRASVVSNNTVQAIENFTIAPKSVTVTANGGSSMYGDSPANPGISTTGLVNGESLEWRITDKTPPFMEIEGLSAYLILRTKKT
jgi:hypothetical protein